MAVRRPGRESNLWPLIRKSDVVAFTYISMPHEMNVTNILRKQTDDANEER